MPTARQRPQAGRPPAQKTPAGSLPLDAHPCSVRFMRLPDVRRAIGGRKWDEMKRRGWAGWADVGSRQEERGGESTRTRDECPSCRSTERHVNARRRDKATRRRAARPKPRAAWARERGMAGRQNKDKWEDYEIKEIMRWEEREDGREGRREENTTRQGKERKRKGLEGRTRRVRKATATPRRGESEERSARHEGKRNGMRRLKEEREGR
ncbi:hypothetical protein C8J57DRAFT_1617997 [Mycena rebaudengoi]|nr:hypothetical protein C8J57DRAFT_1617997 [Mycena rebaudengoi]